MWCERGVKDVCALRKECGRQVTRAYSPLHASPLHPIPILPPHTSHSVFWLPASRATHTPHEGDRHPGHDRLLRGMEPPHPLLEVGMNVKAPSSLSWFIVSSNPKTLASALVLLPPLPWRTYPLCPGAPTPWMGWVHLPSAAWASTHLSTALLHRHHRHGPPLPPM